MPRYKLIIAYDGTDFCGWQKQEPLEAAPPGGKAAAREGGEDAGLQEADGACERAAYAPSTPLMQSVREGRVALRTVQGVVEQAVREVVREPIELIGASRTDSGVHARGQVGAFSCEPRSDEATERRSDEGGTGAGAASVPVAPKGAGWPLERGCDRLVAAINSRLPEDVLVLGAEAVSHHFDPVGGAKSKGYSYTFHCSRTRPLWDRSYVHHVWNPRGLDVEAMNAAAGVLVGEHDFAAFASAGHGRLTTVRRVFECRVLRLPFPEGRGWGKGADFAGSHSGARSVDERTEGREALAALPPAPSLREGESDAARVRIEISGSGFLWNMVRIVAGTLMQVGLGQRTVDDVRRVLEGRDRNKAGPTAPPTGLCLEWIKYQ